MALTLLEGNKYSQTQLRRAVIDLLVKDSRILEKLPFIELMGNSFTYNVITTRSGADFYGVGEEWVEATPELTQYTVTLKILGGDADVDNFLIATRSNIIDLKTTVINDKIKSVQEKFLDTFYYGDATTYTKQFNGLQALISSTTYNTVSAGSGTGSALSIAKLRQAIDLPTGFKPTSIVMSKAMRRGISIYLDSIGDKFPSGRDEFGRNIQVFDGMEIIVDDHIVNVETAASGVYTANTGGANTSIFILTFAEQACCGVQGSAGVIAEPIGTLETKDAIRTRIKWYTGLMFQALRSCAKVDGIVAAGTVTA